MLFLIQSRNTTVNDNTKRNTAFDMKTVQRECDGIQSKYSNRHYIRKEYSGEYLQPCHAAEMMASEHISHLRTRP